MPMKPLVEAAVRASLAASLALVAASCGGEVDSRIPCTTQAACGSEFLSVCEQGFCSAPLPPNTTFRTLQLDVHYQVKLRQLQAARLAIVYPTTPDGKRVVCPGKATGPGDVEIGSVAALFDRAKYNLSWSIMKFDFTTSTNGLPVSINGPGRVVYVELYEDTPKENEPESGGPPVGRGCVADVPYVPAADVTSSTPPIPFSIGLVQ